jgi:hypothetical protein
LNGKHVNVSDPLADLPLLMADLAFGRGKLFDGQIIAPAVLSTLPSGGQMFMKMYCCCLHERFVFRSSLKSGNACCLSVRNILSSSLLSKNLKIKIHRTIMLPVVLCGCETWSLILREERRLRGFENSV